MIPDTKNAENDTRLTASTVIQADKELALAEKSAICNMDSSDREFITNFLAAVEEAQRL